MCALYRLGLVLGITPAMPDPQSAGLGPIAMARITAMGREPGDATATLQAIVRLNAIPNGVRFEFLSRQRMADH